MITLNVIEEKLNEYNFEDLYNINLREVMNDIYNTLMKDELFVSQVKQPLNSKSSVYDSYVALLENYLIGIADNITLYNILTDDIRFFVRWRLEMFELIYKTIKDMEKIYDAEEWFVQTDFDTMEEISNINRCDFPDGEDGDQDFVDAVDEWWSNLDDEEKVSVYEEYA